MEQSRVELSGPVIVTALQNNDATFTVRFNRFIFDQIER